MSQLAREKGRDLAQARRMSRGHLIPFAQGAPLTSLALDPLDGASPRIRVTGRWVNLNNRALAPSDGASPRDAEYWTGR